MLRCLEHVAVILIQCAWRRRLAAIATNARQLQAKIPVDDVQRGPAYGDYHSLDEEAKATCATVTFSNVQMNTSEKVEEEKEEEFRMTMGVFSMVKDGEHEEDNGPVGDDWWAIG